MRIIATHSQLAKLAEVLTYAFQEGNYFDMGLEAREFELEIDDNPAIYDKSDEGNAEAICHDAICEELRDAEEKPALSICGKCGKSTGCEGDCWCRTCNADICSDCNCGHNTWGVN
jgi:hypothetical protein